MPDQNFSLDALLHRVLPRDDHLRDCIGPLTLQSNGLKVPQVTRMLAAYIASTNSTAWLETLQLIMPPSCGSHQLRVFAPYWLIVFPFWSSRLSGTLPTMSAPTWARLLQSIMPPSCGSNQPVLRHLQIHLSSTPLVYKIQLVRWQ